MMIKQSSSKYKKFNISVLFLFIVFYTGLIYVNYIYYFDSVTSLWMKEIWEKKQAYSDSIKTHKLIVFGGSNVLFSMKTETIEKELRMPTVNLGINAGMGLPYQLYRAKRNFIKPGDTVLLSVEYEPYNRGMNAQDILIRYLLTYDRPYLKSLGFIDIVKNLSMISVKDFVKSLEQRQIIKKQGLIALRDPIYNEQNVSKNGDQLCNKGQSKDFTKRDILKVELKKHLDLNSGSMNVYKNFIEWCKLNDVKLIFVFPSIPYYKEYSDNEYKTLQNDLRSFYSSENIPILNTPDILYFQNRKFFFDTEYHMNYDGREIRTKAVIRELKKIFNK